MGGAAHQGAWQPWTGPRPAPGAYPRSRDLGLRLPDAAPSTPGPPRAPMAGKALSLLPPLLLAAAGLAGLPRPPAAVCPHPRHSGAARPQGARWSALATRRSPGAAGWAGAPGGEARTEQGQAAPAWQPGPRALRSRPGGMRSQAPHQRSGSRSRARQRRFRGTRCGRPKSRELSARRARRGAFRGAAEGRLSTPPRLPDRGPARAPSTFGLQGGIASGFGPDGVRQALGPRDSSPASPVAPTVRGQPWLVLKGSERARPDPPTHPRQTQPPGARPPQPSIGLVGRPDAWVDGGCSKAQEPRMEIAGVGAL